MINEQQRKSVSCFQRKMTKTYTVDIQRTDNVTNRYSFYTWVLIKFLNWY